MNLNTAAKQTWRFIRVFAAVFVPEVVGIDGPITRAAILALIPAALEVAYRQWRPVTPPTPPAPTPPTIPGLVIK